nr:hypothetical protein [Streptomyces kanamyceticus]
MHLLRVGSWCWWSCPPFVAMISASGKRWFPKLWSPFAWVLTTVRTVRSPSQGRAAAIIASVNGPSYGVSMTAASEPEMIHKQFAYPQRPVPSGAHR